ncbi:MAG: S41 family peptidase [Balneolaceae bacterium]|nr:S41 family peptidase [Balneolaceae bacterium]
MNFKKFLAPNIAILIVLSSFWFAGVDPVVKPENERQKNLQKYVQVQRYILDNYVRDVSLSSLYKNSIKGLVSNMEDSTADLENTPLDTTFSNVKIDGLRNSIKKFETAYSFMSKQYPNEDMTKRTEDAIRGMFDILDPHSMYIMPKASEAIEENFEGKFQGVGIQFQVIEDTITVISPIAGGPSDKLGIQSGDRIIGIGDSSAVGFDNDDVRNALRGPKGTKVDVTIKRPMVEEHLDFTIVRDDIPLYTVDTSYMLDQKTGYVKINRFAATTHQEFMDAMEGLEEKGMERIILDLRGNPGGYLGQAIAIAEEFFPKGTKLLSTKSRHLRFTDTYYSRKDGEFKNMPIITLVNEGSASASEIVSGALQDHDRGLIVGRRTFGKGLVQQQYGLVDSSNVRVTISRYYTPSGRLIQKPYSKSGSEEYAYEILKRDDDAKTDVKEYISHVPDSLKFTTDAGRTVYGGGGIVPDHIVEQDTSQNASVINFMRQKSIVRNFVRDYLDTNGNGFRSNWENDYQGFREQFQWNEQDFDKALSMLEDHNFSITNEVSKPDFKSDTLFVPPGHYEEVEWMVGGILKAELAGQVWGWKKYYPVFNDVFDNTLKKSMNMWNEVQALEEYAANHSPPTIKQ